MLGPGQAFRLILARSGFYPRGGPEHDEFKADEFAFAMLQAVICHETDGDVTWPLVIRRRSVRRRPR